MRSSNLMTRLNNLNNVSEKARFFSLSVTHLKSNFSNNRVWGGLGVINKKTTEIIIATETPASTFKYNYRPDDYFENLRRKEIDKEFIGQECHGIAGDYQYYDKNVFIAIENDDADSLEMFKKLKKNLDMRGAGNTHCEILGVGNSYGPDLLQYAAFCGSVECVEWFLKNGVNIYNNNFIGLDALEIAAGRGNRAVVEILLAHQEIIMRFERFNFFSLGIVADLDKEVLAQKGVIHSSLQRSYFFADHFDHSDCAGILKEEMGKRCIPIKKELHVEEEIKFLTPDYDDFLTPTMLSW